MTDQVPGLLMALIIICAVMALLLTTISLALYEMLMIMRFHYKQKLHENDTPKGSNDADWWKRN